MSNNDKTPKELREMYPDAYCEIGECTNEPKNEYKLKATVLKSKTQKQQTHIIMVCDECYDKIIKGKIIPRPRRNFKEVTRNNIMPRYQNNKRKF